MISQLRTKLYLLSFICCFVFTAHSQNKNSELINASLQLLNSVSSDYNCCNTLDINKPFYEGKIILKDSTIRTGKISIKQPFENELITILSSNEEYIPISNKKIKKIILTDSENKNKTIFLSLNDDGLLYRQIYKKDAHLSVYDSSDKPLDHNLVGRVFIKENNTLIDTWNFWSSSSKKDLINYLNERDGTNYKKRDFKSLNALFAKL